MLKTKLEKIQAKKYTENNVSEFITNISYQSKVVAKEIKSYTKDISDLQFNFKYLSEVIGDFYYTKFAKSLFELYDTANNKLNQQYEEKIKIVENYTVTELMDLLDIRSEFRLNSNSQKDGIPFKDAILEANKLKYLNNPEKALVR